MRIPARQMRVFQEAIGLAALENEMVARVRWFAPLDAEAIGDDGVRRVVRLGGQRARAYGLTNPGYLRFHVELMFVLGSEFDVDPLLPWVRDVLGDAAPVARSWAPVPDTAADGRPARLYDAFTAYLRAVAGPDRSYAVAGLQGVRRLLDAPPEVVSARPDEALAWALASAWPERAAFVGEPRIADLVRRADTHAEALAAFALGHGLARDPLFPWVERASLGGAPGLARAVAGHLDRVLAFGRSTLRPVP